MAGKIILLVLIVLAAVGVCALSALFWLWLDAREPGHSLDVDWPDWH